MKILVPTDFSEYAGYALKAAKELAKRLDAEIHLYHSANIPEDWEKLPVDQKYVDVINKEIAIAARNKMNEIKSDFEALNIPTFVHYTGGSFVKNINEIIQDIGVDLIIMGSHGGAGRREWFIGTKTQKVLRRIDTKTLVVKNDNHDYDFSNILFVTGLTKDDREAFKRFLSFIKPFNVKELHILSIDLKGGFSNPLFLMTQLLKEFKEIASMYDTYTYFFSAFTVDQGVRQFVQSNNIDLIAISNHKEKPIKHTLLGSNTVRIVNYSNIPVLSIDFKS